MLPSAAQRRTLPPVGGQGGYRHTLLRLAQRPRTIRWHSSIDPPRSWQVSIACLLAAPVKPTARLMPINSRKGRGLMSLCMVWVCVPYCVILVGIGRDSSPRLMIFPYGSHCDRYETGAGGDRLASSGRISACDSLRPSELKTRKRRGSLPKVKQPSKPQQSVAVRLGVIGPANAPVRELQTWAVGFEVGIQFTQHADRRPSGA